MTAKKLHFRRMFETKSMRPYYSVAHLQISESFKDLAGFAYQHPIDIVSAEMNNESYHEEAEMAKSTEYFRKVWMDAARTKKILDDMKDVFRRSVAAEKYGWKQNWETKKDRELVKDMRMFYGLMSLAMTRTVISQPQHVLSLDQGLNKLLEKYPNRDEILPAATYFKGKHPWIKENDIIEKLHGRWASFSKREKDRRLQLLVHEFGWFNDIEGDQPFSAEHYRQKIEEYKPEPHINLKVKVPSEVRKVGRLIGELGFLRFWGRYHFMALRYHLKKILQELIKRSGNPDLEYATVEEVDRYFKGKKIDWAAVKERKNGYAMHFVNGIAKIATGEKLEKLRQLVREEQTDVDEIKGVVANKGKTTGRVRVISFTARDYDSQVAAFRKGEILVTGMTRPQIVHLCRKASAIITDEGGITSHAAVVGREFGIPCVIATHNATRILKTGDLIKVDADAGIVKIIERAK